MSLAYEQTEEKGRLEPPRLIQSDSESKLEAATDSDWQQTTLSYRESRTEDGLRPRIGGVGVHSDSSSGEDEDEDDEHESPRGRFRKPWINVPWIQRPRGVNGRWLKKGDEATEWLNLFYDLVVVAVLGVFSSSHDLASPDRIPAFFSYFVIISWVWTSQVHYDLRFQAEDEYHRIAKGFQIILFVYIGAASGNWSLDMLQDPGSIDGIEGYEIAHHEAAKDSFFTVVLALILSRACLAFQYFLTAFIGRRNGRKVQHQLLMGAVLTGCMLLGIVSATVPSTSRTSTIIKIFFLYFSLAVEMCCTWFRLSDRFHLHIDSDAIAERYGALTLIIIGEGFVGLARSFNAALSGLSDRAGLIYLQVFLTIGIMVTLYMYLFSWFKKHERISHKRVMLWEALHLPLHFGLLLLQSSMVNVIIVISFEHGMGVILELFTSYLAWAAGGGELTPGDISYVKRYINYLPLYPNWEESFEHVHKVMNETEPVEDGILLAVKYLSQVVITASNSYGLKMGPELYEQVLWLNTLNTTLLPVQEEMNVLRLQAINYGFELPLTVVNETLSGTLWLYPTAGFVLILAALRSFIWYRFEGKMHWLLHGTMMLAGTGLCLLGLLDLGHAEVEASITAESDIDFEIPSLMYRLTESGLPLIIVFLVYTSVYLGFTWGASFVSWFRSKRRAAPPADLSAAQGGDVIRDL